MLGVSSIKKKWLINLDHILPINLLCSC
jgi:hypothetical protein